jgi:hypothetical protein
MIFARFSKLDFPICLTILHTPMSIAFYLGFLTWGSHCHFVEIRYKTRGPIGKNVVYFNPPLRSSPYNSNPPYSCFPFIGEWYVDSRSYIKCGFYFFTIARRVFNIRVFSVTNEVCNLVSIRVGPFYITSSWFSYFRLQLSYFGRTGGIQIIRWVVCE